MFDLDKVLLAASKYNLAVFAQGQQEFTDPGTYNFVVPSYVENISAVAVGGGGGGSYRNDGGGGGGGALSYKNQIAVTPGETLTVTVGAGGIPGNPSGTNGGISKISRGATVLLQAEGGYGAVGDKGGQGGLGGEIIFDLDSASYTLSSEVQVKSYRLFASGKLPPPEFGETVAVFGYPVAVSVDYTRFIRTTGKVYLNDIDTLFFKVNAATSGTWGDPPDGNTEALYLEYSLDASSWTTIQRINPGDVSGGKWYSYEVSVPSGAKTAGGVYLRYRQFKASAIDIPRDVWAMTSIASSRVGGKGGTGGSGNARYGGNSHCGGGGGAGGYSGNGGDAGTATGSSSRVSYKNGTGGAGAGGQHNNNVGTGGGGVGLHGLKNDGIGNGGGGSSYTLQGIAINSVSSNSSIKLYPVSLSYAWSNFMNSYAVWTSNYGNTSGNFESVDRVFYAPYTGTYVLQQQADNTIIFKLDGSEIARTSDFRSSSPQETRFFMTAGRHVFTMEVQNAGGGSWGGNPAGFAVVIRNAASSIVWDTRSFANGNSSNISTTTRAGGTNADGMNGGDYGGGGSGRDGGSTAGAGGRGGVRIIWGERRSYPYAAEDVSPFDPPPRGGLILHYDFNNANSYTSGSTVTDLSGNGNSGSINRSTSALTFVGANETFKYLEFPSSYNQKIDFSADELTSSIITVDMWAKIYQFAGGMFFGWNIHDVWTASGTLGFNTGQGDVFGIPASRINSLSLTGKWIHYTFVMNAGDYNKNKIYINGISENLSQQYSSQYTPYANFNSGNGRIGGWRYSNDYQQIMDLAIFRVWNRGLSSDEVLSLYGDDKERFTVRYESGLYGRRVGGYYSDNVNYWNGRAVTENRVVNQLNGFSSGSDQYSWQFKGYFIAPSSGTYNFRLYSDDASHLWLGSNAVSGYTTSNAFINHGGLHAPSYSGINSIYLEAGSITPVRIMFGENYGQDVLSVLITGPGISGTSYGLNLFFHDDSSKIN